MSTLQTGKLKDLSIYPDQESFILSRPDLMTKMFSGNMKYNVFSRFQPVRTDVCAYVDATLLTRQTSPFVKRIHYYDY